MRFKFMFAAAFSIVALAVLAGTALADRTDLGVQEQRTTSSAVHEQDAMVQADGDGASVDAAAVSDHKAVRVRTSVDRQSRTVDATPCVGAYQVSLCQTASNGDGADREPELRLPFKVTIAL